MLSNSQDKSVLTFEYFACFSFLWAIVILVHQLRYGDVISPIRGLLFIAAWLVILRPSSLVSFLALAMAQLCEMWFQMPFASNHWILVGFVNLTSLFSVGCLLFTTRTIRVSHNSFLMTATPVIRLQVLILYFWGAIHKFNSHFFNPQVSCATTHKGWGHFSFLPQTEALQLLAIYGTVLIEATIPLLLIQRRTRPIGLFLGLAFHYGLGLFDYYDFSTVMIVLLLFFEPEISATVFKQLNRWAKKIKRHSNLLFVPVLLASFFVSFRPTFWTFVWQERLSWVMQLLWALFAMLFLVVYFWVWYRISDNKIVYSTQSLFSFRYPILILLPLLLFLNGLMPYIGGKTQGSFSMYSNLSTEDGNSNHFFIPASWQIWNYQRDLVQIIDSDDPYFLWHRDNDYSLIYFQFWARALYDPNIKVIYKRNGIIQTIQKTGTDSELSESIPYFLQKIFYFRPVDNQPLTRCLH